MFRWQPWHHKPVSFAAAAGSLLAIITLMVSSPVNATESTPPSPADPLTVAIETGDADRFAALYERTGGKPTAEQLQRDYIDVGSYGVHVFTPNRIVNATNLTQAVSSEPELYSRDTQLLVDNQADYF